MIGTWLGAGAQTLQTLGYAIVLTLWHTTLLALVAWGFSRTRRGASPSRRHWTAFGALLAALALAVATWWVIAHPGPSLFGAAPAAVPGAVQTTTTGTAALVTPRAVRLDAANLIKAYAPEWAAWVALFWASAVCLLLLRLVGGILMAWWIRRRAMPLPPRGPVPEAVRRVAERVGYSQAIEVVESTEIEYPAATGWRKPGLIVPCGLDISLSPSHLEHVIAHEVEHLRGGDQRIALVQALAETMLFFCPGARWLSRQAREAREHRCDDVAVQTCGSAPAYAAALGVLASRASGTWLSAVMGVLSPSLANRIRRILKGDTVKLMNRAQVFGLFVAVAATIASGAAVLAVSLEGVRVAAPASTRVTLAQDPHTPAAVGVPTGFVMTQDGAPLSLSREVFLRPVPEVSRALIASQNRARPPGGICRDDRDQAYSPGWLIAIRGEHGGVAKCTDGVWEEQKPTRVTAPMKQRGLDVNLPAARRTSEISSERLFVTVPLSFRRDRIVQLNEEPIRVEILQERVRQAMVGRSDKQVFLRGDGGLSVQELLEVIDKLKEGGVEKVGIIAKQPGER